MKKVLAITLFQIMIFFSTTACSEDIYVIANKASTIGEADIKDIFTGEKQVDHDVKVKPIDNASIQNDFLDKALHITQEKYLSLWIKKGFRDGLTPPTAKSNDMEVIALVKSTPGGISYVSKPSDDVKVIKKF